MPKYGPSSGLATTDHPDRWTCSKNAPFRPIDFESVRVEDVRDEVFATLADRDGNEFWPAGLAATGPRDDPRVQSIEDNLELVASGGAVRLAPASVRNTKLRPDVAVVRVVDVEPVAVVVASADPVYEFADVRITYVEDPAAVTSFTRFAGVVDGKDIDMWARETNVLRKVDGVRLLPTTTSPCRWT